MNGDDKAKTHNTPKVEISVRNFGPIAEADLDLRPLTVFVGPSNTGKTYLSVLIYALHRVFEEFSGFPLLKTLESLADNWDYDDPADKIQHLNTIDKLNIGQPLKFSDLPKEVGSLAQVHLNTQGYLEPDLRTELERCCDLESVSGLIRSSGDQNDEMTVSLIVGEEYQDLWSFKMGVSESDVTIDGEINENMVIFPENWLPPTQRIGVENLVKFLNEHRRNIEKSYYLPAARSGIIHSHRVIASSLVTRSTRAGLEPLEVPTLSGVVTDFMKELILYRANAGSDEGMNQIANALESDVLVGQIIMNPSSTGYPEFLYRPQGTEQDMRLTRSSSMVSELAPLVLFIRGLIRPGDTLIIEEPEAHLHPAAQTQMAATLARLVRAGVKVLVTTHSDFMLQEIGNLMRVGMLKEKGALKKETNDWLLPEEVGTWLFQKNGQVKEIEFDRIKGIEPMEYEDVAEALYNRWAGLQNRIEELKDESERE
jgi:predicted ATPase